MPKYLKHITGLKYIITHFIVILDLSYRNVQKLGGAFNSSEIALKTLLRVHSDMTGNYIAQIDLKFLFTRLQRSFMYNTTFRI